MAIYYKKSLRIGTIDTGYKQPAVVTLEIELKTPDRELTTTDHQKQPAINPSTLNFAFESRERVPLILSISGMAKRAGASDCDTADQIYDSLENMTRYDIPRHVVVQLIDIWKRWHLNDMQAACVHMTSWNPSEKITLIDWKWTTKHYKDMQRAENGEMPEVEYKQFRTDAAAVHSVLFGDKAQKWESPEALALEARGLIERGETEEKNAGWINQHEHPRGILSKPAKCGYRYGSAWLFEPLPRDVVKFIKSL